MTRNRATASRFAPDRLPSPQRCTLEPDGARRTRTADLLADAHLLVRSLAARPAAVVQSQSRIRPRAGAVQEAVIQALARADRPLRACEIHRTAEDLAGMPLSSNTVKDCLHKNACRSDNPIERVSHGRYRIGRGTGERSRRRREAAEARRCDGLGLSRVIVGRALAPFGCSACSPGFADHEAPDAVCRATPDIGALRRVDVHDVGP